MDVQQNMGLFRELMLCNGDIYTWCYDAEGNLLSSNCPDEAMLATAFDAFGCRSRMLELAAKRDRPVFLNTDKGLIWGAAFEKHEGILFRCHIIGPVIYNNVSANTIYRGIRSTDFGNCSAAWYQSFAEALYRVPSSQYTIFSRDLLMLHYCVTGRRIDISDVFVDDLVLTPTVKPQQAKDRHRVWSSENAMLQMVRLGDLNYSDALNASMLISDGIPVTASDPVQQAKVSCIVFCSLVCRAAIDGGLSPEEGYSVGDAYIQSAVDAHTVDELSAICINMYDDFIHRVHRMRENPSYSRAIQRCCDFIDMNLNRNIHAKDLAQLVGYTDAYLTRRFREETGFGISDYLKAARIERAKLLLQTTDLSVQQISDQLGYTTRSYFSHCFRQITGMTPIEFRNRT